MAKREPTQENQEFSSTVEMFYPQWRRYVGTQYPKKWSIGAGAYFDLAHRVAFLEDALKYGISPTIRYIMRIQEQYGERDSIPGAASLAYEWQSQLGKIMNIIENMLKVFDDLEKRLNCYVNLTRQVSELLKLARSLGNRNIRDSVLTLHDAICGTYSEDLTSTQAEAIKDTVQRLYNLDLSREQVRALDRELRKSGLETIPSDRFVGVHSEQHSA